MQFYAIVAMAKNRVIGNNDKLPWHISEDLKLFKKTTLGHRIIMGRKTFASLGYKALQGRENIILSKELKATQNITVYNSFEKLVANLETKKDKKINFVIGGETIYRLFMPYLQKIYLSAIQEDFEGDTYFPKFEENFSKETEKPYKAKIPFSLQIWNIRICAGSASPISE